MILGAKHGHLYEEVKRSNSQSDRDEFEIVIFNPLSTNIDNENPSAAAAAAVTHANDDSNSRPLKNGTIFSGFFNISNTILGSSVLGLPYAFSQTGWALGTFLLIVCACSSAFALHTLSLCALKLNRDQDCKSTTASESIVEGASFYSVAKATMPRFTAVIDIAIALKCMGVAISYLIVVGDLMPFVMRQFGASGVFISRELWVLVSFTISPKTFQP